MKRCFLLIVILIGHISAFSKPREVVLFDLKFGIIKGGEATLIISDTTFNGASAIHYSLAGRTTGLADKLFGVNDIYETTVSSETGLPFKFVRNIREKKYRYYNETLFFHDNDSIFSQRSGGKKVPPNLVDILSVFFYFFNHQLMDEVQSGHKIVLPTYHADNINEVGVIYTGKEKIDTELGNIECYVLIPEVDKGKLFNRSDGLKFYVSVEKKTPVLLDFDMRVGALRAILRSYKINGIEQVTK